MDEIAFAEASEQGLDKRSGIRHAVDDLYERPERPAVPPGFRASHWYHKSLSRRGVS
jgi:hypothetical protein